MPPNHVSTIQRNAIASWAQLPGVDVVLVGCEDGIEATARELGVRCLGDIKYNQHGTPLVNSAFDLVRDHCDTPLIAYCNSDVILFPDFVESAQRLFDLQKDSDFVAFGRRIDLRIENEIDFASPDTERQLKRKAKSEGRIATQVCKEYFVFNRDLYRSIPEFAIGRGNWDNWMVWSAKKNGTPVINVSEFVTAVHQMHNYQSSNSNRRSVYMTGDEAKNNQRLAGGRHWISGSVGTHRLTENGVEPERHLLINPHFWADVPRFIRLAASLATGK